MRNKLLATVAMTALIGCTSFAVAQNREGGAASSPGAQQHQMGNPGGAMSPSSGGNAQTEPSASPPGSGEQGKSFSQEDRNKSSTKPKGSAQEERGPQKQRGAEEQRGKEEQRGAQNQRKEEEHGAQNQRGTEQHGAQDNDRAGTQERTGQDQDRGKAVSGQAQQNGTSGRAGASVQLSQEQRTKIKDVIVRDRNVARVDNVNFSVSVGARVPRDIHVAVLPPEVVTIVPEYRGFDYVVVGDQLLIIDPNTMEIVVILPA
jgi:Protein of unknown function (DUF1236)